MGTIKQQFIEDKQGKRIAVLLPIENYNKMLDQLEERKKSGRLTQNWAGGLKGEKYSSIDLQKKALDWRQK